MVIKVINIDIKLSDAISILSCIGAIGSTFWAFKSAREAKTQKMINQNLQAMEIWKNIGENKEKIFKCHEKFLQAKSLEEALHISKMIESFFEDSRNFFEILSYAYKKGNIDKEYFKEMYKDYLKDFVENSINKEFYTEPTTKYIYTNKVYKEFK